MSRTPRTSVLDNQVVGHRRQVEGPRINRLVAKPKGGGVEVSVLKSESDSYYTLGLVSSLVAHALAAYVVLVSVAPTPLDFREQIFSVTIEGGKTLGGISQVPDESKKAQSAVPRKVSEQSPEIPKALAEDKPKEELVPVKDAEVSLSEAKPTPKPVPTKKATPIPAKATPVPVKATPKPKVPTKAELDKEYQATMQKYLGESSNAGGKGFGAAKVGGTGMGGGALRPPEFFRYKDLLEAFVKGGWRWIDPQAKIKASVVFDIGPDGNVSSVRIDQSSGNREFDESVLRAVYKANPVPKPPPSVYEQYFKTVRMIFEPE